MLEVRTVREEDVSAVAALLQDYMRETFGRAWSGSEAALLRDGFGRGFRTEVAARDARVVGFVAWQRSFDVHHMVAGGNVIDLYVGPDVRGLGVAVRLAIAVAARVRAEGGVFLSGQAVESGTGRQLYERLAMSFPGADCIVGGRAFRTLADLHGSDVRTIARSLPERAWNFEP